MFGSKNKEKVTISEDEHEEDAHKGLIVHNMPNQSKVIKTNYSNKEQEAQFNQSVQSIAPAKNNFKAIGLLIIIFGLIFVIVVVYLGYKYVIKPGANDSEITLESAKKEDIKTKVAPIEAPPKTVNITPAAKVAVDEPTILSPEDLIIDTKEDENNVPVDNQVINLPLIDSDKDGLNDDEEAIFGTDARLIDSDSDGHEDLAEIQNTYNPAGSGLLTENTNISIYENEEISYTTFYPTGWGQDSLNNGGTVLFTAPDNSLIQISVQDNPGLQSIIGWYEKSFPRITVTYDELEENENWSGIMGVDGLNFYLTNKNRDNIYIFSYIPVVNNRVAYPTVFRMMIDMFLVK